MNTLYIMMMMICIASLQLQVASAQHGDGEGKYGIIYPDMAIWIICCQVCHSMWTRDIMAAAAGLWQVGFYIIKK